MLEPHHLTVLKDMLALPTAPFAEHRVLDYIREFCSARGGVTVTADAFGNLLVRVRRGGVRAARPVCITAHTDHPGFVAQRMTAPRRLQAQWRGGVPREYFKGARVRFSVDGRWVKGTIRKTTEIREIDRLRVDSVEVDVPRDVPPGSVGMWDFPDPRVRGTRIFARGCDDVAGAAALLCTIDELTRSKARCDAYFLFTRAEEVGFVGAIAAARARTVPAKCLVVCMETSSERINARIGDGPILRVGDKTCTFAPNVTAFCERIAKELADGDKGFVYQRKLMDGGTCESSAFCALGYDATGMCVALGNYHNVDARRKRLGPEYVDLNDLAGVVQWFTALATTKHRYTGRDEVFHARLDQLNRTYRRLLRTSVKTPC